MSEEKSVKKSIIPKIQLYCLRAMSPNASNCRRSRPLVLNRRSSIGLEESKAIRSSRFLRTSALKFTKVSFSALSVEMVVANQPCLN